MRYASILPGLALLVGLAAAPADAGEPGLRVRGFGALLAPDTSETEVNDDGENILIEAGRSFGGGAEVEYQFHRFLGLAAGFQVASPEMSPERRRARARRHLRRRLHDHRRPHR